eukprot:881785-Pyramimonas_sp.AAC.1
MLCVFAVQWDSWPVVYGGRARMFVPVFRMLVSVTFPSVGKFALVCHVNESPAFAAGVAPPRRTERTCARTCVGLVSRPPRQVQDPRHTQGSRLSYSRPSPSPLHQLLFPRTSPES